LLHSSPRRAASPVAAMVATTSCPKVIPPASYPCRASSSVSTVTASPSVPSNVAPRRTAQVITSDLRQRSGSSSSRCPPVVQSAQWIQLASSSH
jgi:hypothetical protein